MLLSTEARRYFYWAAQQAANSGWLRVPYYLFQYLLMAGASKPSVAWVGLGLSVGKVFLILVRF